MSIGYMMCIEYNENIEKRTFMDFLKFIVTEVFEIGESEGLCRDASKWWHP